MTDDPDVEVTGNDPLVDGMVLSVRLRYDFTVTDAERLLATARSLYRELNGGASAEEAAEMVTGAADALFAVLEHAGMLGDAMDETLAAHAADGLARGGCVAQAVINQPNPLSPDPLGNCFRMVGDVFALPEGHPD